ncbi:MAG: DUF1592 domain-containing protein [Verrucomicrobia bacterium]|nr:DUF1592 domain-containing protein [Verrucomicrobiota bacterium]
MGGWAALMFQAQISVAAEPRAEASFRKDIQPILQEYCYDCHGDGTKKGEIAFDELKSGDALLNRELWWKVLKNLRAGIMPPEKKPRPSAEQRKVLEDWIKYGAFGIDPQNPDPGRVTIRRLNRVEYRNTIRDLMGFDFKVEDEFPPDDTGYGFDNIGDVLTVSPLLIEKYMDAAKVIVASAVPTVSRMIQEKRILGTEFLKGDGSTNSGRMNLYKEWNLSRSVKVDQPGSYRLVVEVIASGSFDFDPGRTKMIFKVNDRELLQQEFGWEENKKFRFNLDEKWEPGDYRLGIELRPVLPEEKKPAGGFQRNLSVDLRIAAVTIQGPLEKELWGRPRNFELFFTQDDPQKPAERRPYAQEVLRRFTQRAYRRPADLRTIDRLAAIAEAYYSQPGKTVEEGIGQAMIAVLASPRFIFRVEESESPVALRGTGAASDTTRPSPSPPPSPSGRGRNLSAAVINDREVQNDLQRGEDVSLSPGERAGVRGKSGSELQAHDKTPSASLIDEYSLASRLSYSLWSTMPDEELFRVAERGALRKDLTTQVKRMIEDPRSEAFIQNFPGQWLQARDVEGIDINARAVLAKDDSAGPPPTNQVAGAGRRFGFGFRQPRFELDRETRQSMRRETEMFFASVVREDRAVTDLIDSDYTFLNEKLARHYGLTNLNVTGPEMRRVALPKNSPRGGVLTQGTVLTVTSNPTRTSPVKRGLFVLDNILGAPAPPPPGDVPLLEDAEKEFKDREPTLREVLELHRSKPLCSACHSRMDPLGLALENFNALGLWRDNERGQPVDPGGKLITGATFTGISELKRILATDHRIDFFRCLTEKVMTYALGRGLEYYDVETVDQIVARLERDNGRFSALLAGVIESAPFQKRRNVPPVGALR